MMKTKQNNEILKFDSIVIEISEDAKIEGKKRIITFFFFILL